MITLLLALSAAQIPDEARLQKAVLRAIQDETGHVSSAIKRKDMDQYMDAVPNDYRIEEDDGSVTDKTGLRAKQTQAWALITRTNRIDMTFSEIRLGCGGECAFVKSRQRWDRQMLGRDGVTEFNVVTTQDHEEKWALQGSRWRQTFIKELGGTVLVDGKPL